MGTPPTIQIASLGMADSLILMVLALVVFGPRRLPQIGRQIGKLMYEFRKASNDFKFQMEEELRSAEDADRRKKDEESQRALALAAPPQPAVIDADSRVSEANPHPSDEDLSPGTPRPGEPGMTEATTAESPYPDEGVYPAVPPSAFKTEEPYPRIQPPSTGEQVPAARPGSLEEELAKVSEATTDPRTGLDADSGAIAASAAAEGQASVEPTTPATEQAHHG